MPVGCDEDSDGAPGTLKPAEQEASPRAYELRGEPPDRIERGVEGVGGQQLELHTGAEGPANEHEA
ncbi:MAG TPA: hypothetical protein VGI24_05330 [Solirubrobacteraceae bacterium]